MLSKSLAFSAIASAVSAAETSNHWAVIVAGSNGFWNYRH
jgi:glycosylphosphatidylinositol transamidase (GPIT) subunit GPI8